MNLQPVYSQQELDAKLLAAANALRGPVDPADFKAYVFPLLFLKRISDDWHWEYEKALELYDGDEDLARLPENFRFVVPDGCLWEDVLKLHENIGAGLQLIFDRLQEANPETLAGVFGTAQWANKQVLPEERLLAVLDVFSSLKLDPGSVTHDLLGNAYEYLLKNFADESGKKAGEFFTPREVVRLMVQLLDPKAGESIYDPTCGSGGMLVESVNQVRAHGQDPRTLRLYGQEVQATTAAIARMNLYLHDIETFAIRSGDTLRDPKLTDSSGALRRFDAVIANPPFAQKNWGHEVWANDPFGRSTWGVPPTGCGDFAFVEHMIASMDDDHGRMAVVMPHSFLFKTGDEGSVRRNLIETGWLYGVVGLPRNLFYNTSIAACVLLFRRDVDARRSGVLFVDASQAFTKTRNKNQMDDEHVDGVVRAFRETTSVDVGLSCASMEDIEAQAFNLSLGRYVPGAGGDEVEAVTSLEALSEYRSTLTAAEDEMARHLKGAGLAI